MKETRGGKYVKKSERGSEKRKITHRRRQTWQQDNVSYDFWNAKHGYRTIPGINKEDVLKKARQLGYKESDIIDRNRE